MATDSSFVRPTLAKLIARAKSDIATRLTGADANLRASPEEVLAIALAGLTHGTHGHLKWLSRQVLADLADDEFLVRMAGVYGLDRIGAVASTGAATITGTTGTTCPADTVWTRADGASYVQDDAVVLAAGTATIALTASVKGEDGDAAVGTALTIGSAVAGIDSAATVSGDGLVDGAEIETILALRARLLSRLQTPPQAGGPGDYVAWALEVAGVTRAWQLPLQFGPGTVGLYFMRDDDVDPFPSVGEVATVQAYIDTVRPVTADVVVMAPVESVLNFTFTSLVPATAEVKAAISAELTALLYDEANPNEAVTISLSQIDEVVSLATGETSHVMSVPSVDPTAAVGTIRTLGTITWP